MSLNIRGIPFKEIEERALELARDNAFNTGGKVRGILQNVYLQEFPRKYDWSFLRITSALTLTGEYDTGTVSATTGGTQLTFNGATIATNMLARKIKIGGNDFIYDFDYSDSTGGTTTPAVQGTTNPSGESYTIFKSEYSLPEDFDRFLKGGGLLRYSGGSPEQITEAGDDDFIKDYNYNPSDPDMCRLIEEDTLGRRMVEVNPPPSNDMVVGCEYLKELAPLSFTSAGLLENITASGTTVLGDVSCKFTEANTGDYLRVNALGEGGNSKWYRVSAITHDSQLTLSTAFANTGITSANYIISSMPDIPTKLHEGILWSTLCTLVGDQDDPIYAFYNQRLAQVLSDGKRLYVTRIPNQKIETIAEDYNYRR